MKVETITVTYPGSDGPVVINKSDYDEAIHSLEGEKVSKPKRTKKSEKTNANG